MKSPFPGMDPYLEEPNLWPDVHLTLIIAIRSALNATMPPEFVARADRYVWIHEPDASARAKRFRPDAYIVPGKRSGGEAASSLVSKPTTMLLPAVRKEGNKYLKIIDAKSKHLVTVIELLSPGNKRPGPDREAYLAKRIDYLTAGVNLVEFDLLRAGERMPFDGELPACDYYALVCRAVEMPKVDVWPFTIRDALPTVPIPLLPGVPDVPLDLRTCLDRAIDEGRYVDETDYTQPPDPPLSPADAQWARHLLTAG